jgi:hypothetical protein
MSTTTEILRDINAWVIDLHPSRPSDHTVWVVTADTFAIGNTDLDNQQELVGVYATLEAVARDLPVKMAQPNSRIYNPMITQALVVS